MSVCTKCGELYDLKKTGGLHCELSASSLDSLVEKATVLSERLATKVAGAWEDGSHPRIERLSLIDGAELAGLVRDLAKFVDEHTWHRE